MTLFHVYPRPDMEAVLAGHLHPGEPLPFADAVRDAACYCGRSAHDVERFARPVLRGRKPRVFIAGPPSRGGFILAHADDPQRQPFHGGTLPIPGLEN